VIDMAWKKINTDSQSNDWEIVGWLNTTEKGKVVTVKDDDGALIGFILVDSLKKLAQKKVSGVPIKRPR